MELFPCPKRRPHYYWRFDCGTERDCVPGDGDIEEPFQQVLCDAIRVLADRPGGLFFIYTGDRKRQIAKVTSRWVTAARLARCGITDKTPSFPGRLAQSDAFTVDVPGIQDIIKLKDWDSKQLRYERYRRFATSRSSLPDLLQWIPPLLTKLDNAQDMIFVGLALAIPIIKRLPARVIPGVGWLLLLNDILNLFT